MMELYSLNRAGRLPEDIFSRLLKSVGSEKKEKICSFHKWEDAHRTLFADLLIRFCIARKTGFPPEMLVFSTNAFNKPVLKNRDDLHFSLSHSGDWVVCAVDRQPVGVDIEEIRSVDEPLLRSCLSEEEHRALLKTSPSKRLSHFYTLWTLKESYLKAVGKGLWMPLDSFSILYPRKGRIALFSGGKSCPHVYFKTYTVDSRYAMAVCTFHRRIPDSPVVLSVKDIFEFFLK
ncbi:MAG: 4'-phosphopantetheinyl transferase superfamily protein [Candidatus Aminicenantales bacterium]